MYIVFLVFKYFGFFLFLVCIVVGAEGMIAMNVTNVTLGGTLNISCKVEGVPQFHEVAWFFCINDSNCTPTGKLNLWQS